MRNEPMPEDRIRLVALSFLMLFVELALIRWTASNVIYLSYFSNFVLLGSFLGIGVGFLRARAARDLFPWAPVVLAAFVVLVLLFPVEVDRSGSTLIFFGNLERSGLPVWAVLPLVFAGVAAVMALIGEGVARVFVRFSPLEAYRLDIIGSLAGVGAFTLLAFLRAPPVAWGVIVAIAFAALLGKKVRAVGAVALLAIIGALLQETLEPGLSWSPYYKVSVAEGRSEDGGRLLNVHANGIPHQVGLGLRAAEVVGVRRIPYQRARDVRLDNVLIIGSGTGTDVGLALQMGAQHVDAVEIDPRIQQIGRERQPGLPYSDPRVTAHIEDGRAFLERTDRTYDLILFALPDSLVLVSGQSSLRLENYLFTTEALSEARRHLKSNGVFAMYNLYRERWLVDRLGRSLSETYGHSPCVDFFEGRGAVAFLTTTLDPENSRCASRWEPASGTPAPVRDDYPFLYLKERTIPGIYLLTLALILAVSVIAIRRFGGPIRAMTPYVDLFFMGASFLLLETKNVVQFALLFGTTWLVNALVFSGILIAVLLAVAVARRVRLPKPSVLYAGLFGSLGIALVVPERLLLDLPVVPRLGAAIALAFTPIFFANLIFAQRFRDAESSTSAFAANLLGAMVGGVLEYASLVTGYRALLVLVAVLYAIALLVGRRASVAVAQRVAG